MRLLPESLGNATRSQRAAAAAIALLVLLGIAYFAVSATQAEREHLRRRGELLDAEVKQARTEEASLRPLRPRVDLLRSRLDAAVARLPRDRETPAVYQHVSDLARQSGLSVAAFAARAAMDKASISEIPISLTAEGSFHQLSEFFSRLTRSPRIVTVADFHLSGIDRPTGSLRAELALVTYRLRPDSPAPPGGAGPARAPIPAHAPAQGERTGRPLR